MVFIHNNIATIELKISKKSKDTLLNKCRSDSINKTKIRLNTMFFLILKFEKTFNAKKTMNVPIKFGKIPTTNEHG